jgi:hypothetical protein
MYPLRGRLPANEGTPGGRGSTEAKGVTETFGVAAMTRMPSEAPSEGASEPHSELSVLPSRLMVTRGG